MALNRVGSRRIAKFVVMYRSVEVPVDPIADAGRGEQQSNEQE